MEFAITGGILALSLASAVVILIRQHIRLRKGLVAFVPRQESHVSHPALFALMHDMEVAMLAWSSNVLHASLRRATAIALAVRTVAFRSQTVKNVADAVSGKKPHVSGALPPAPSMYLKDIADHKNNLQKNGNNL